MAGQGHERGESTLETKEPTQENPFSGCGRKRSIVGCDTSRLALTDLAFIFATMSTLQEIEAAALRLPEKDRLHLADKILGSLPAPLAPAEPDEILAEAIRRDAELESGKVRPLTEEGFWAGVRRRSA